MSLLFEDEFGVDNSPEDKTEITTTILYYSKEELKEFKKYCKIGIQKMFNEEKITKGNVPDLLFKLVQKYAND